MSTFIKSLAAPPLVVNLRIGESLPLFRFDFDFEKSLPRASLLLQNRVADANAVALHEFLNDFPCF